MSSEPFSGPKLRELGLIGRLGILCLLIVFGGGLITSAMHMYFKHHKRDDQPKLTVTDVKGVYHGVRSEPLLKSALDRKHPETLKAGEIEVLRKWLESGRIIEDYENIDLGDATPKEIMSSCVSCHAPEAAATQPAAAKIPLRSLDDMKAVAFSREVQPNDIKILAASTHAHALALASMSVCIGLLCTMTSWRRRTVELCWLVMGLGLIGDIGSWWIARQMEAAVYVIIGAGALYNGGVGIILLMLAFELLRPRIKA
jgi:hypothetical protein